MLFIAYVFRGLVMEMVFRGKLEKFIGPENVCLDVNVK